jgi:hypothetical protein
MPPPPSLDFDGPVQPNEAGAAPRGNVPPVRPSGHDGRVRFEVTPTLDAIERRLATDPLSAGAVVDLAEVVRLADLSPGRPAMLLRLGHAVDALAKYLGDGGAAVYPVAERGLLSDTDLSSNERMVVRRWSDDGLVEILPAGASVAARLREIAELTGLAIVTRAPLPQYGGTAHALLPAAGGAVLGPHPNASAGAPAPRPHPALRRWWRCPVADCPSFGPPHGPAQSPPALSAAVPTCPRHGERLADAGPCPDAVAVVVSVQGTVRHRFAVVAANPVVVGRLPDDPSGVSLARHLDERSARWISRSHARFDLRDGTLTVTDTSTNGTVVVARTGPGGQPREITLGNGQSHALGEWDTVRLHDGIDLRRAGRPPAGAAAPAPGSVMSDAPTVALRLPRD